MIILTGALWTHPLPVHENLVIAVATLAGAYLLYAVVERPIRRSVFLGYRPWLSIAMGVALFAAAFLVSYLLHASLHPLWSV
jgi:hypothetical protein